ncbi:MATE efflux family protein 1 [Acorus calamus]|uniref:Protein DETOXIFICATION n=1 Tax=Acorus calamus TaxID=4465 RepID=A0AAV9C1S9_ACOCL|nr:MATE efflux family protein 1 [Acorus calamus]
MDGQDEPKREVGVADGGLQPVEDMAAPPPSVESPLSLSSEKKRLTGFHVFYKDISRVFKLDELGSEIARIAIPAALALAADPVASLVDTAFVGHIGPVELAAVGVSIAVFNQVSKVAIYPLVSVTTSFVAEEDAACKSIELGETEDVEKAQPVNSETKEATPCSDSDSTRCNPSFCSGRTSKRKHIPSVTSALIVGGVLGILQAILLIFGAKPILHIMGVKSGSPMLKPACQYLTLRALGSPAVLLSLAMQGVFRGFKDTKTPLYATGAADASNIALDAILIFVFRWGVSGAAIAHAISQYLMAVILLLRLIKKVDILPPSFRDLKFGRFLKCGFLLLGRVIAVTFCVTLAASIAAHQGSIPMAAFQICLQVWLATSLVADGLAVAGQAIIASSFAKGDHPKAVATASRVLQLGVVLGLVLTCLLGVGMQFGSTVFTKDANVIKMIHMALPFVAATQPINSVAFVFDGINFGASDYAYSAYSMIVVAGLSIMSLFLLSSSNGFIGIWIALTIYISLRMFAGIWRLGAARGPWSFLHLYPICS